MSVRFVLPLFAAIGCAPTNTTITDGSFIAFLADATSGSLATDEVDPNDEEWQFSYNVDCRTFETNAERQNFQLPDPIRICPGARNEDVEDPTWPPEHEPWADRGAYRVVGGDLDVYRGDALVNSEGDVQFAFHHRLPGGADFRWTFAVDPDFQPTNCEGTNDGQVVRRELDGDWIEEWSTEVRRFAGRNNLPDGFEYLADVADGGRVFFLNANAYQLDPEFQSTETLDDRWFLPNQWLSGAATGRFAEDLIEERASRFGEPGFYEAYETLEPGFDPGDVFNNPVDEILWYCDEDALPADTNPRQNDCMTQLDERMEQVEQETYDELRRLASPDLRNNDDGTPVFTFRPITHVNTWRRPDGAAPGLDAWGQIEYSFVVFSADSVLEPGGTARGAFQILFEGIGSTSRVMVKGNFETERIRTDRWGAQDLFADKAEENGVELCFEQ
ncbi:MAG: hypothetical protein AAGA48_21620 [Myxococcota bacterium]